MHLCGSNDSIGMAEMKKILVAMYNTDHVGGPNVSNANLMNSYLKGKFEFERIVINDYLGKIIKVKVLARLIKEIHLFEPDVILIGGLQLHGFYMMMAAILAGYKDKTVVVHGSACDDLSISKIKKLIFGRVLEPFTVRNASKIITVCQEMANNPIVSRNAKKKISIVHNAIPLVEFDNINRAEVRQSLDVSDNEIVITYTGRIVSDKGIQYLLDAFKKCNSTVLRLFLVGDGPEKDKFIEYVKKNEICNVSFLGQRNDVMNILCASDIFVFPSLHENLPNSIVEACLAGLPVIATNVGGIPEIISEGCGLLIASKNAEEITTSIELLAGDSVLRATLGKNAKQRILSLCSQEVIYSKYDEIFENISKN